MIWRGWCLARPGEMYAVYLPEGGSTYLKLIRGNYIIKWYNPRSGGKLQNGSVTGVTGPGKVSIGNPPNDGDKDWAVLVKIE